MGTTSSSPSARKSASRSIEATRSPALHALPEDRERDRARVEHSVVEAREVEARAELRACLGAELHDLELADLVSERLSRPHDVAVHLVRDVVLGEERVRDHEID